MKTLKINDRFKNTFAPLTEKEYSDLEFLLKRDGCMYPIITWQGQIIDGHNRYEIWLINKKINNYEKTNRKTGNHQC